MNEITQIYQAINAVSERVNDIASRLDAYTNARVNEITPYEQTQTAYYGESEKNFYNVPQGILTVYFDNYTGSYNVERIDDRMTVSFDTLKNDTSITIIVQ